MRRRNWTSLVVLPAAAVLLWTAGVAGAAGSSNPKLVVEPVGTCQSTTARGGSGPAWIPTELPANLTSAAVRALEFYSVGSETVLGPRGWDCAQVFATDGSAQLMVYPPGSPRLLTASSRPAPGARLVDAKFDYTGHGPGHELACPYFGGSTNVACTLRPAGEDVQRLTPDVVRITDPARVRGNLDGSGGSQPVSGLMVVPQSTTLHSQPIAEISCSLKSASLCTDVLNDFVVREFPVPTSATG